MKIVYFSQLSPKQKDRACFLFLKAKFGFWQICDGLAKELISSLNQDDVFNAKDLVKKQKMAYFENINGYLPVDIKNLL